MAKTVNGCQRSSLTDKPMIALGLNPLSTVSTSTYRKIQFIIIISLDLCDRKTSERVSTPRKR